MKNRAAEDIVNPVNRRTLLAHQGEKIDRDKAIEIETIGINCRSIFKRMKKS